MMNQSRVTSRGSRVLMFAGSVLDARPAARGPRPATVGTERRETRDPRPETRDPRLRTCGFTLFELVVAFVVVLLLGTAFLERLRFYQEMAERAAMESTLRQIKTGLQIRLAELIITNRQGEATHLETEDPTRWLDMRPANYAGLYREKPEPGAWYFDRRERQLVYVAHIGDRLTLDVAMESKEIRFRARLLKDQVPAAGGTIESVTGVTLTPVYAYRWS